MRLHRTTPVTRLCLAVAIAAACAVAVSAGPAGASTGGRTTIAVSLAPDLAAPVSCPGDALFGFALRIASLRGKPLGTGRTCVDSIRGCEPFTAFCRQTVRATLTFDLARGSLTARVEFLEIRPTDSSFIQLGSGQVSGGTGAYAAVAGRLAGGGTGAFDDQLAFTGRLVYVASLHGVR